MSPPVVLVTSRSFASGTLPLRDELADAGCEVLDGPADHALEVVEPLLARADAWIAGTGPITAAHLAASPGLRIVARYGVGVDAVDLEAAATRGVLVTNTPGANAAAVAEHAVALILAALRDVPAADRAVRSGDHVTARTRQLSSLTVGIVGLGRIGRGVAALLRGFGARLLAADPYVSADDAASAGVALVPGDVLLRESDLITLHAPGDVVVVDAAALATMRDGVILVNTARSGLVDEAAVAAALRSGRVRRYAADVVSEVVSEEGSPRHRSPLLADDLADRTIFTPHTAAHTVEAVDLMGRGAVDAVLAVLRGERPAHPVPQRGDGTYMGFVGVSTGGSSIMRVFPEWAAALGLPTRTLRGHDLAVDAPTAAYRALVEEIRDDPRHRGALVTTHKLAVYAAAADLFDELDETARTFGEISCVTKRDGRLLGSAKDPLTGRLALAELLADDHFAVHETQALVLGCGGAGLALVHQLATRPDRPTRITCTALTPEPLEHARAQHARSGWPTGLITYALTPDAAAADRLVAALPDHSLVANATGMGKDRPGSPVTDAVVFPRHGVIWEFNYRGPLDFWHQARAQQDRRGLDVQDGWRYFVHGWAHAVADVFDIEVPAETVDELGRIAARMR